MKMNIRICFKIPGEDITFMADADYTVKELVELIRESYKIKYIAYILLNGRKFHFGGAA